MRRAAITISLTYSINSFCKFMNLIWYRFTRRISWFTRSNRLFQLTFSVEEPLYFIEYRMFNGDKVRQKSLSRIIRPDSS